MLEQFFETFLLLFVVIDPLGLAVIFAGITHGDTADDRRRMAVRGTLIAASVLVVFALVGDVLLRALNIGLAAFRIAGGGLLFLLAVDMVFARHSGVRAPTAREQAEAERRKDISVFPLAIPLIAGPGAITTVLLKTGTGSGVMLGMLAIVLALTLVSLMLAPRILKLLGQTGTNVIGRVFGIVLAALAVQFMLDGLTSAWPTRP